MPRPNIPWSSNPNTIIAAYADWGECLVEQGWTPHLLTFMFRHLRGSPRNVAGTMECEVERVYATLVRHNFRRGTAPSKRGRLPFLLCCPDYPFARREGSSLADVLANDGRHLHAAAFMPPVPLRRGTLETQFADYSDLYVREPHPLLRVHVEPVTHTAGRAVGYALKALRGRRVDGDDVLILPRHRGELIDAPPRRGNASIFA